MGELSSKPTNQSIGSHGEDVAVAHLESQGYEILDRNWHCRWGEIDIVAAEQTTVDGREGGRQLVFCEVKTRTGRGYGSPLESITFAKMQRLRRLAGHWLKAHESGSSGSPSRGSGRWSDVRIDAIGVVLDRRGTTEPEVNHVKAVG